MRRQHGGEAVVFVQQADRAYLARRVSLGRFGDDTVEILSGLKAGDKVIIDNLMKLRPGAPVTAKVAAAAAPAPAASAASR